MGGMHDGRVEQIGAPLALYDRPENLFVAGLIGSPAMNFFPGTIRHNGSASFDGPGGGRLPLQTSAQRTPEWSDGTPAVYGVRPEHFVLADDGIDAGIQVVEPTGSRNPPLARFRGQHL